MKNNIKTIIVILCIISSTLFITRILTKKPFVVTYLETPRIQNNISENEIASNITNLQEEKKATEKETPSFKNKENQITNEEIKSANSKAFSGITKYQNNDYSFEYLSSWTPAETAKNSEIDFLIDSQNAMFSIVKEKVPKDFKIEDYVNSTKTTFQNKNDSTIINVENKSFNNIEGSTISYEVKKDNVISKIKQFITIHNENIYVFTLYSNKDNYDNYVKEYENLLSSLTFIN